MYQETKPPKKTVKPKKTSISKNYELKERLTNARVVQKDLLYVIGLSPRIANKDVHELNL
jgi:hypothetical protein